MKKISLIFGILAISIIISGCGKDKNKDIIKTLTDKINNSESYKIIGTFELKNNEESYIYNINVQYKKEDNFKVSLINKTNNHEQIILKNAEGVYVLTPSLNKSYKFQSDWPYNNSQTYILQSLLKDIEEDSEKECKETNDGYIITTSVNYSSKKELVLQNIYLDKEGNINRVEVLDTSNQPKIIMTFTSIDYNANIDNNTFKVETYSSQNINTEETVGSFDGIIFPMYIPTDTYLTAQDVISTETGQRAILTFNGESPFTIIQETITPDTNIFNVPINGEPYQIMDTIGVLSDSYVSWISNGIEYYVISEELSKDELLNVANSISVMPVIK